MFTSAEVHPYLEYIQLPPDLSDSKPAPDLDYLTRLHVAHISTLPYENLSLHYAPNQVRRISVDPREVFKKSVLGDRGRGGYCMESSLLFLHMLRALGFDVYPTGVRMRLRKDGVPDGDFIGLVHVVLIVTFENQSKYVVDIAFGGDGPTRPLPLIENFVTQNLGSQEVRYIRAPIPQLLKISRPWSGSPQLFWQYQYRNGPENEWRSFYAFNESEFLHSDFEIMNHYTSEGRTMQRELILVIKFFRNAQLTDCEGPMIRGKIMLVANAVKCNYGGRTELVKLCRSEAERVAALKEYFGIILTAEEEEGIRGWGTEITPDESEQSQHAVAGQIISNQLPRAV